MSEAKSQPGGQSIPEERWSETLSRFAEKQEGCRVSVEIQEPGGSRKPLASESHFELGLVGLSLEERDGQRSVRLVAHEHPGGKIETVELASPARIVQGDGSLSVESADGHRLFVQVIPAAPGAA